MSDDAKDKAKGLLAAAGGGGSALVALVVYFNTQVDKLDEKHQREFRELERELIETRAALEWVRQTQGVQVPGWRGAPLVSVPPD